MDSASSCTNISTLPRLTRCCTKLRSRSSKKPYARGTRQENSKKRWLTDLTSTSMEKLPTVSCARPKPVILRIMGTITSAPGAYSDKSPLVALFYVPEDGEYLLTSTSGRRLLVHTGAISVKTTRNTIGVQVMTLKGRHTLQSVVPYAEGSLAKESRYRTRSLPAAGAMPQAEDFGEQMTLL